MQSDKRKLLEAVNRNIAGSQACRAGGGRTPVFAHGNPDCGILIVGEGPGKEEEEQGKPFVGASGRLLRRTLAAHGLDLERDFFVSNIVRYRSLRLTPEGKEENRPPSSSQIEGCREFLKEEIAILKPALIITLGVRPAQWFLGRHFNIREGRGRLYEWHGTKVFPTYHPASAMRPFGPAGAKRRRRFEEDLAEVARMVKRLSQGRDSASA